MRGDRTGVAPAKETTPCGKRHPAIEPLAILPEQGDGGELTPRQTLAALAIGPLFLFCLMWLAAAY